MKNIYAAASALAAVVVGCAYAGDTNGINRDAPSFDETRMNFITSYVADTNAFNEAGVITAAEPLAGENAFWIAKGQAAAADIFRVDAATGEVSPLFDSKKVRRALKDAGADAAAADGLSLASFELLGDGDAVLFSIGDKRYVVTLGEGKAAAYDSDEFHKAWPKRPRKIADQFPGALAPLVENASEDKMRFVTVQDSNLYLREAGNETLRPLTTDGEQWRTWGGPGLWQYRLNADLSPDGQHIFAVKLDARETYKLPIIYWLEEKERVDEYLYPLNGEPLPKRMPYMIDPSTGDAFLLEDAYADDSFVGIIGWREDSSEAWFGRMNRTTTKFDIFAVDPETKDVRNVFTEERDTFIDWTYSAGPAPIMLLPPGKGFLFLSERSGLRQIYHYDENGVLLRQLTDGAFPVFDVPAVDAENGYVYFRTGTQTQNAYDKILHRVPLSGGAVERLVEADGQHEVVFSEDKNTFLVTHSRIARPPVTELRAADGELIAAILETDISKLNDGWTKSEEFWVKARDGVTDLHGVIMYPPNFDPEKKYPVIEAIYAGMHVDDIPRDFLDPEIAGDNGYGKMSRGVTYADYIVVRMNTPGTRGRGKAFHDATYLTWPEEVIEEHAHVIRELGKARPYMDLDRVGIFGASWGGYMTLRALIYEPDLYKVGVAIVPVAAHDETLIAAEPFLRTPQENPEGYAEGRLFDKADRIKGDVLLIAGPLDVNANFAHTMKFANALIEANKDYHLYVIPDMNHSIGCCGATKAIHSQVKTIQFFEERL